MNSSFRLKQEMGARALQFCQAQPADSPRYTELVGQLEAALTEGRSLVPQFGDGLDDRHAAAQHRLTLRDEIHTFIRRLVKSGQGVAREVESLNGYFRVGSLDVSDLRLVGRGRQYLEVVEQHRERFAGLGFGPVEVASFHEVLDALEQTRLRSSAARGSHTSATREMRRVGTRIMRTVELLDALNMNRFAGDSNTLAAWVAASSIPWPRSKAAEQQRKEGKEGAA
ncbi:MAG: hypothetical protein SF070_05095 [Gemmatimonadota bacterium]|nr:hypothetical protein [Gemmatimonadota bacterium]